MKYAEVYINIKTAEVNHPFDYEIPENLLNNLSLGSVVLVPFKNRKEIGYVTRLKNKTNVKKSDIKKIEESFTNFKFIDIQKLKLIHWMSNYYVQPFSKIANLFFPPLEKKNLLKIFNSTNLSVKDNSNDNCNNLKQLNDKNFIFEDNNFINNYEKIKSLLESDKFNSILIKDILLNEKIQLINKICYECLKKDKNIMLIFPVILSAKFFFDKLNKDLKDKTCFYHSEIKKKDRIKLWEEILTGKYRIILGTRSTLFLPTKNLGIVILDDEHDTSYKDPTAIRYNTQDVAIKLCKLLKIPLIFFSNSPSIKTMYLFNSKKNDSFNLLNWCKKDSSSVKIEKIIVDLKKIDSLKEDFIITNILHQNILEQINSKNKALLFVNKKGFASFVICKSCGYIPNCSKCATPLRFHRDSNLLVCHHCGSKIIFQGMCTNCGCKNFEFKGIGIEKIEAKLKKRFTDTQIFRIDSETIKKNRNDETFLDKIKKTNPSILLTTQIIFNQLLDGLYIQNIGLIAIIDFDKFFIFPDFHVNERVFQLLEKLKNILKQDNSSKFLIQTYQPDNIILKNFITDSYENFYFYELKNRKELDYPPFSNILNIIASGKNESDVINQLDNLLYNIEKIDKVDYKILGPSPAPFSKINFNFRWHAIIKVREIGKFNSLLLKTMENFKRKKEVKIIIDVDPVWIL